nr:MAG: Single-stranded DNA-binding protein [Bacteriophage sp.]
MADNELTVANGNNFAANGANAVSHFFNTDTMDGKMALYNAMQTSDKIDDHLNEPLHVTNVLAQAIEVANQETGEVNASTRVVVHAEEGDFAAASPTLAHAFGNLFAIFGTPDTWSSPLALKVVEKKSRRGYKFFDLELLSEDKRK